MVGLYGIMALTACVAAIVILSFIGPEKSEKPFWIAIQKIRSILNSAKEQAANSGENSI